jgi:Txe/YoeB family toxin of Txe-Axe toxin-antitoxin module
MVIVALVTKALEAVEEDPIKSIAAAARIDRVLHGRWSRNIAF